MANGSAATDGWSVAELTERVADALAGDAVRAPNGRVRDLPDARAIRWYATIGLVDRPLAVPGRVARYGPRHLLQLVAVKRRQAQGRTLAQIQAELTGATDETLRKIARVPDEVLRLPDPLPLAASSGPPTAQPARPRFWAAAAPAEAAPAEAASGERAGEVPELGLFPLRPRPVEVYPEVTVAYQIGLPGGVTLSLSRAPTPDDLLAIQAASTGLLALLADRDLLVAPPDADPPAGNRRYGFRPNEAEPTGVQAQEQPPTEPAPPHEGHEGDAR